MKYLFLVTGLFFNFGNFVLAQDHDHHKTHKPMETSKTKSATRFTADSNLKTRMEKILNSVKSLNSLDNKPELVKSAGNDIEATINDIFKNCKLAQAADEAIHPVLAALLQGAQALKNGQKKEGHDKIDPALLKYAELFDHPGWNYKTSN